MHRFLQPVPPPKPPRKTVPSVVPRCPYWCHTVFLVLSQFSPFCTPGTRGQGHGHGPKPRSINAKKPRVNSGFRGKTLRFEAFCRSGETGIRTLGTRKGTPVFKTGAIGRSAISPGRMLRPKGRIVNEFPDGRTPNAAVRKNQPVQLVAEDHSRPVTKPTHTPRSAHPFFKIPCTTSPKMSVKRN